MRTNTSLAEINDACLCIELASYLAGWALNIDTDNTDVRTIATKTAECRLVASTARRAVRDTDLRIRWIEWVNIFSAPLGAIVADRSGGVISDAAIPFLNCLGGDYSCRREPRRFISFSDNIVLVRQIA
jgi:hypothetical protein